jgi:hypothetical protein
MAMNTAGIAAATTHESMSALTLIGGTLLVTAIALYRRPIRHCGRSGGAKSDGFKIAPHRRRHFRPLDLEILVIGRTVHQHLARAVVAIGVVALTWAYLFCPALEILQLLLRLLREQVVGDAHGELAVTVQLLDDLRPTGNLTGAVAMGTGLGPKRLALLHEAVPRATVFGALMNPAGAASIGANALQIELIEAAARSLGLQLRILSAGSERDLDGMYPKLGAASLGAQTSRPHDMIQAQLLEVARKVARQAPIAN